MQTRFRLSFSENGKRRIDILQPFLTLRGSKVLEIGVKGYDIYILK